MKRLLVLGAGTAGTMAVNKLRPKLPEDEWNITVVEPRDTHYYQPGYLFIPFGTYTPDEVVKPTKKFIPAGVDMISGEVDKVVADENKGVAHRRSRTAIRLPHHRQRHDATPDQTPGMAEDEWHKSIYDFYLRGDLRPGRKLKTWEGKLVIHITEMPIKCPVAPLEFTFLADAFFEGEGHARQGGHHVRDAARGRVHEAGGLQAPGRHAG